MKSNFSIKATPAQSNVSKPPKKASIFAQDDDENDEQSAKTHKILDTSKSSLPSAAVDSTIFAYDEIYDETVGKERESEKQNRQLRYQQRNEQSSKYIGGLMQASEERKREQDRRKADKIRKEAEEKVAEGTLDASEIYVTSAYKKHLMEEKRWIEEKQKQEKEEQKSVGLGQHLFNSLYQSEDVKQIKHSSQKQTVNESSTSNSVNLKNNTLNEPVSSSDSTNEKQSIVQTKEELLEAARERAKHRISLRYGKYF